jgi:cell division inhibitor SulA
MKQLSMYEDLYEDMHEELFEDVVENIYVETGGQINDEQHNLCDRASLNRFVSKPAEPPVKSDSFKERRFKPNVTEIVLTRDKIESIQLILPMLINLHQEKRWLAWIDPPVQVLKEWQQAHNEKALNEIMILRSSDNFSVFELSKRALEAGTCHAVIAWTDTLNQEEFSKLEIASAFGNSHGIILRSRSVG